MNVHVYTVEQLRPRIIRAIQHGNHEAKYIEEACKAEGFEKCREVECFHCYVCLLVSAGNILVYSRTYWIPFLYFAGVAVVAVAVALMPSSFFN